VAPIGGEFMTWSASAAAEPGALLAMDRSIPRRPDRVLQLDTMKSVGAHAQPLPNGIFSLSFKGFPASIEVTS